MKIPMHKLCVLIFSLLAVVTVQATPGITVSPASLPDANLGVAYGQAFAADGGDAPYTYAVTGGSLPGGLSLASDGALTGTPLVLGSSSFDITATDTNGITGVGSYTLNVTGSGDVLDVYSPTVAVTAPARGVTVTNSAITIVGAAGDNAGTPKTGVALVLISFNYGAQQAVNTTNGFKRWTASVTAQPGWNSILVQSFDFRGNASTILYSYFFYKVLSPLPVTINGSGKASYTNNTPLVLTTTYGVTATPSPKNLFSNWVVVTGAATNLTSSPKLSFVMQTNVMLTANFVTNDFTPVAGKYHGLFSEAGGVTLESAGLATITVTPAATKPPTFSGALLVNGVSVPVSGGFDIGGNWTSTKAFVSRIITNVNLSVTLHLDLSGGDTITGTVSNNVLHWTAPLVCHRAKVMTNYDGDFTMVVPHDPSAGPSGDGYGSVIITNGALELYGMLGEGTVFKQKVGVSASGLWPLYVQGNKVTVGSSTYYAGLATGWLTITSNGPSGTLTWMKSATPPAYDRYYQAGFTNSPVVISSPYTPPATGTRMTPLGSGAGHGLLTLDYGSSSGTILSNNCVLSTANTFTCATNYGVTITTVKTVRGFNNGFVQGSFINPAFGVKCSFLGMVLQNTNEIRGFFAPSDATNTSGAFRIEPN